jgi:hypothetical protein
MARFAGIPPIPQTDIPDWNARILAALKENVELLTGQRGELGADSQALTAGSITARNLTTVNYRGLSASGQGVAINNVQVPTLVDYSYLLRDFQNLAADVENLRNLVNILIDQLKRAR